VVFQRLSREDLKAIVAIQLERVRSRLAERGLDLEISERAQMHLADRGYDPIYGARPLKRTIQRELQDPLAMRLLSGEFQPGEAIQVDAVDGELVFESMVGVPA
jgi:ATP-dependent Clp protease ATP-binding subunit ClpA